MHTLLKFPDSHEGKRLLQAREQFQSILEQIKRWGEEYRGENGPFVHLVYKDEAYVTASRECEVAERAYYMATGDESQLLRPPIPREKWGSFQKSVEKHFGKIAQELNTSLVKILPWSFGFATEQAVVILEVIDIDRGLPCFFVFLRPSKPNEKVKFSEEVGSSSPGPLNSFEIGSIIKFQTSSRLENRLKPNSEEIFDETLKDHAKDILEYGKSFLTDPKADWDGLRDWDKKQKEKWLAENPHLKKYL